MIGPWRVRAGAMALAMVAGTAMAQDRLKTMPGYDQYQAMSRQIPGSVEMGSLSVTWVEDGKAFEYRKDGKTYRYDLATNKAEEKVGAAPADSPRPVRAGRRATIQGQGPMPARGRQFTQAMSPDGTLKAFYRDRNLWISDPKGVIEMAVTTDGNDANKVKSGTATWVYGEELYQNTAMWWSPDSTKVAFYRFDESQVKPYYLALDQTKIGSTLNDEPYPKVGDPNPVVDVLVYDVKAKTTTKVDVRDGKPFDNDVVGHYVYGISWTPDGKEILLHRTNRKQNIMELAAADPATGKVPRGRARGVARKLGREHAHHAVAQGQQAVPLGIRAQRVQELLPVRPGRNARSHRHQPRLRGRPDRSRRRGGRTRSTTWRTTATTP